MKRERADRWRPAERAVVCPACGQKAIDAGDGSRPRWRCDDPRCRFHVGWRLEFKQPETVNAEMLAVPIGASLEEAVPWPRH